MEENLKNAELSNQTKLSDGTAGIEYSYKVMMSDIGESSKLSFMFKHLSTMLADQSVDDFSFTRTTLE